VNAGDTAHTYIYDAFLADLHDADLTTENLKLLQVDVELYNRKQQYKPDTVWNGDKSYLRTVQTQFQQRADWTKGLESDQHVAVIGVGRMIVDYLQVSTSNAEKLEERKLHILNPLVIANNELSRLHLQCSQA